MTISALCAFVGLGAMPVATATAAEFTSRQITELLVGAKRGTPVDFTDRDLSNIDLSGLDFSKLTFLGADFFGADLTNAKFDRADLSEARLDRVTIIGISFVEANMQGVSLLRPSGYPTINPNQGEGVTFARANLKEARIFGRLNRSDFSGADLSGATLSPFGKTGFIEHIWRTELQVSR